MRGTSDTVWSIIRLTGLLACAALATSRFGLVAHELGGHGGVALSLGGKIQSVQLFWFAGGWIRYDLTGFGDPALLAVAMGGIAIELLLGGLLWWRVRGDALGSRLVRGVGGALVIHAGWYASTGAWHGFGDGARLYAVLGAAREPVAAVVGVLVCGMTFLVARSVVGALAATVPGSRTARGLGVLVALGLAGGLHVALALGEVAVRQDPTYTVAMTHEREREIAREMAEWERAQAAAGVDVADEVREQKVAVVEQAHQEFPFRSVLGVAVLLAAVAGGVRSRARPLDPAGVPNRLLLRAAVACAAGVALVILLDVILGAASM